MPAYSLWLVALGGLAAPCKAEVSIRGQLITTSGDVVDTLDCHLDLKDTHLRRSLEGRGPLADFFGHRVELLDRASGESVVLDLEHSTYSRAKGTPTPCHPFFVFDLRWLGRTQGGAKGNLVLPETSITILGHSAFPIDFRFRAPAGRSSIIRIWVIRDLDSLFGARGVQTLYCGVPAPAADAFVSRRLAKQFGLSDSDEVALREVSAGFPAKIESFLLQGTVRTELSCFEALEVKVKPLSDSLFVIPGSFHPVGTDE